MCGGGVPFTTLIKGYIKKTLNNMNNTMTSFHNQRQKVQMFEEKCKG